MKLINEFISKEFQISRDVIDLVNESEKTLSQQFNKINQIKEFNQLKVIRSMQKNRVSDTLFGGTTGYGYGDVGRDTLDAIYAEVFGTEDALVRSQIVAGTQAIAIALYGNLSPGDELISISGKPYDTLDEVIGIKCENVGSLRAYGVLYNEIALLEDGNFDYDSISKAISPKTKMLFIQRSRGYTQRNTLMMNEIKKLVDFVKNIKSNIIVMVDNCYGEFVEEMEPTHVGADLVAGSLIKNPGGGLAPTGGYVAGRKELVENAANRLIAPGLGKKVGCTNGISRLFYQGFFIAPHIVAESHKGALLCAEAMKNAGYKVMPEPMEARGDIIQSVIFNCEKSLIAFCQGIQKGSPVDSFVSPEPWDMPGYDSKVIMAAGAFIQGSSIELSCDAPIKPPYVAYLQGGLVYEHAKLGIMTALQELVSRRLLIL